MNTNKDKKENQVESKKKQTKRMKRKTKEGQKQVKEAFGQCTQLTNIDKQIAKQKTDECDAKKPKVKRSKNAQFLATDKKQKKNREEKGEQDKLNKSKLIADHGALGHASDTDEEEVERAQTMLKFELL